MPEGSADDTTRYLCAATYLDPAYAKTVIKEFLVEPTRPVPPSPGLDAATVLTEAVRSRIRRKLYDALFVVLMLLFLIAAWGDMLLYAWIVLSVVLSLPAWFGTGGLGEAKAPSAKTLAWGVGIIAGVFLLLRFGTPLFNSGYDSGHSSSAFDESPYSSSGSNTGETVRGVLAAIVALTALAAVLRERWLLWQLLTKHFRRGANLDTGGDTSSFLTENFDEELARYRRNAQLQPAGGAPLIVYRGYNPFVGSGLRRAAWSMAVPLERLPDEDRDPATERPLTTASLYDEIRAAIEHLRTGGALSPDARLSKLNVLGSVFTPSAELIDHHESAEARLYLPDTRYPPHGRLPDDEVERIRLEPREWARYYLCFQVETWDRDLVLSTYLHLAVNESTLYLEWTPCMLPPIRASYRAVDRMRPGSYRPLAQGLLEWLRLPASVPARVANLFSFIRSPKREPEVLDSDRYGSMSSLRELAAANLFTNYFQLVDIERYEKIIESRLLPAIGKLLDDAGFSTAKFDEQAAVVINNSITVDGDNSAPLQQTGIRGKPPRTGGSPSGNNQ